MESLKPSLINIFDNLKLAYESTLYSGINSNVYLLKKNEKKYALKIFNNLNKDSKLRMQREINALRLLNLNSITNIPNLIEFDFNKLFILTNFLYGTKIKSFSSKYINQIISFNLNLRRDNLKIYDLEINEASDSLLEIAKFIQLIESKLSYLKNKNKTQNKLIEFLNNELNHYRKSYFSNDFNKYLLKKNQIFSQSDVGIHNCIDYKGTLYFFDFEHSGWDDPAKNLADWILRPNNNINYQEILNFLEQFCNHWPDKNLIHRLKIILPFINIKWILIRLNIGLSGKLNKNFSYLDFNMNKNIYNEGKFKIKYIKENLYIGK